MTMMKRTKHGALVGETLYYIDAGAWQKEKCTVATSSPLVDLCELAIFHRFTHLWVLDSDGMFPPDIDFLRAAQGDYDLLASWDIDLDLATDLEETPCLTSVTGCRKPKGGQHWFSILFPQVGGWQWVENTTGGLELLATILYLEAALKVPVGNGPTTVGMKLLQDILVDHPNWLIPPACDFDELPFARAGMDVIWKNENLPEMDLQGYWLIKADRNSAYLRGCTEENIGAGVPEHVTDDVARWWNARMPGVWRIVAAAPTTYDLPLDMLPSALERDQTWISTPVVKLLLTMGYDVTFQEAWVFPTYHETLRAWAQTLWDIRQSFKGGEADKRLTIAPARLNAYHAIKEIAAKTVGLFGSEKLKGNWKYRPDIRAQVVGSVRALMFYTMMKIWKEYRLTPLIVYMDALYYVLPGPRGSREIPLLFDHVDSLGGFKQEWALFIDKAASDLLTSADFGLPELLSLLNSVAAGQEEKRHG